MNEKSKNPNSKKPLVAAAATLGSVLVAGTLPDAFESKPAHGTHIEVEQPEPEAFTVNVNHNDTLWGLTEQEAVNSGHVNDDGQLTIDVRPYVDEAVEMNGGPQIQAGESVQIPNIPDKK